MKIKLAIFLTTLCIAFSGCGGDGSGSDYNSSFNGKVTLGANIYECKSQTAFDACKRTSQPDCSACTLTNATPSIATITTSCTQSNSAFTVSQNGCVLKLKNGDQTGVCSGSTLKMLSGTGWTQAKVLAEGSTFTSGSLNLNAETIRCGS